MTITINIEAWKRGAKKIVSNEYSYNYLKMSNDDELRWETDDTGNFKLWINKELICNTQEDLSDKIIDMYKWNLVKRGYKIIDDESTCVKDEVSLNEKIYKIKANDVKTFIQYSLNQLELALSAFKKIIKYTNKWTLPVFSNEEIVFLQNMPNGRNLIGKKMYRGINSKNLVISNNIYAPSQGITSWTLKKSNTEYFSRGQHSAYILHSIIEKTINFIDITVFFSNMNGAVSYFYDNEHNLSKEEWKLYYLFDAATMYDEEEILVLNSKIKILKIENTY